MEFQEFNYKNYLGSCQNQSKASCAKQSNNIEKGFCPSNQNINFTGQEQLYSDETIQQKYIIDSQRQQDIQNTKVCSNQKQFYLFDTDNYEQINEKRQYIHFYEQYDIQTNLQNINEQNQYSQSQISGSSNTFGRESTNFFQQEQLKKQSQDAQQQVLVSQNQLNMIDTNQMDEEFGENNSDYKNSNQNPCFYKNQGSVNSQQIIAQSKKKHSFTDLLYETRQLNFRENYYVIGDLFINVNMYLDGAKKNRRDRSSIWNQIRPVNCIEVSQLGYYSIIVDDTKGALEDFDRVISILDKQQHGHAIQQAQWLIQYKLYLQNLEKSRQKIYDEYSNNKQLIQQKLAQNTIKSLQMAEEILQKYYGGQNDYVIYTFRRTNHSNLTQTLYKGGMSQALMKLIFMTEDNYRTDTMRHGMLELFSYEGYESVNYSYIFGQFDKIEGKKQHKNFTLFTVDDLEIELDMEEKSYELSKISLSAGGNWFSDQLRVYKFNVNIQKLFQLSVMRKELSTLYGEEFYKNTEYYQYSQQFIQKYYDQSYKKQQKNILKRNNSKK